MAVFRSVLFGLCVCVLATSSIGCSDDDEEESGATQPEDTAKSETSDKDIDEPTPDPCAEDKDSPECKQKALCTPCSVDGDCGADGKCVKDVRGHGICTRRCNFSGADVCLNEFYCKHMGTTTKEFFCYPRDGVCKADGLDCSPCEDQGDCKDGLTCLRTAGEKFCAKACNDSKDCDYDTMGCGQLEGKSDKVCMPLVNDVPTAKCSALPLSFCQPCQDGLQCESGALCYDKNQDLGKFCTIACESNEDCPHGTNCPSARKVCMPTLSGGCQGLLSCIGSDTWCPDGTTCHKGTCVENP